MAPGLSPVSVSLGKQNVSVFAEERVFFFFFKTVYFVLGEKDMASHCSILAWRIPWMEEPGGLQSMGSQRVRHTLSMSHFLSPPNAPPTQVAT